VRDFATDPEVAADLDRRARSERDKSRTGSPMFGIVEHWPCDGCGAMVGVGQLALDTRDALNRELARRGEHPIPKRAKCDACAARDRERAQAERDLAKPRQTQMQLEPRRPDWMPTPRASRKRDL
jgi:hypothetical protein